MLECRNPENNGVYTVVDDTYCYRAAELHSVTRAAGFKPDDGQLLYVAEIDAGLASRRQKVAERGWSVEELDAEIAADRERESAAGLSFNQEANNA